MSTAEFPTVIGEIRKPNLLPATPTSDSRPSRISPLSSVQRVLLIQEIVGIIMEELPPRSLLHLGLCCQTLYRPTMDRLWRTLPSLARLLRCLPEELVEMVQCREYGHRVLRIKYVPRYYQWERVLFYARRVRVVISSRREVCRETVKMLALHYPGRTMFPNLQETHLSGPSCAREISLLASLSSQTIHYEVDLRFPDTWHIDRIVEHSPDLEVLRITDRKRPAGDADTAVGVFVSPDICYVLSNTLLGLENLTAVDFMAFLDPVTIQYLASLPRLARLALQLRDDCVHMDLATYTSTPFASLHSLQIRGRDTTYLAPWLSSVHLPSLKALNISTEKPPPPPQPAGISGISSVKELIRVVSRFQGLTYLKMRFAITHKGPAPESILGPLLERLPSMEDFTLFGLAFNPTKISLSAMVSAWPRLRNLELHQTCYFKPSTHRIPLRDLLIFAQHCPTIERIAMPLSPYMLVNPIRYEDGAVIVTQSTPPSISSPSRPSPPVVAGPASPTILPPSRLQVLQVADYFEPDDYQRIAEFLANVFPAASLTYYCPPARSAVVARSIETISYLREEYLRTRKL